MQVKSIKAIDYSTGKEYSYGDTSGSWQSIKSNGGTVKSDGSVAGSAPLSAGPAVTSISNGAPLVTSIAGLPSGWTVTPSGKVIPPSAAPVSKPPCFLSLVGVHKLTWNDRQHPHQCRLHNLRCCRRRPHHWQQRVVMRPSQHMISRVSQPL